MNIAKINREFYFRVRRFNGFSKTGRKKFTKRKSVRASYLIAMFGIDRFNNWCEKAILSDSKRSFHVNNIWCVDFYVNRCGR